MVVAYVDSVMSRVGRHLSIQAALEQSRRGPGWTEHKAVGPSGMGPGPGHSHPWTVRAALKGRQGKRLCCPWGTQGHTSPRRSQQTPQLTHPRCRSGVML